ncbi:MAG: MFS transporter [Thermoleophilaceae bacterium]
MGVLALGHMLADTCQGAVPALLPFLIAERHYSYAAVSALVLAATVSSSVVQPLFGLWADRRSLGWLMPAGVLVAGIGIGLAGVLPGYALTFAAIVVSGLGVAAFHPEGSRFANYVSGARRASGMSLFSVGGNAGFALGPILVTPLVLGFGLAGTAFLVIPTAAVALVLALELRRLLSIKRGRRSLVAPGAVDCWSAFARLGGVVAARTFVYFGLLTFVPLYFVGVLHASKTAGNLALALMLVGGACGTLAGGPLADRFGRRAVVLASMAVLPPLILAFHSAGQVLATAIVFVVGAATISTFSVTVVMGQEYLPRRIGVASGVTLGLSIGLGGVGAPLLGLVADRFGLSATIDVVTALPLAGLAVALTLPRDRPAARSRPAAEADEYARDTVGTITPTNLISLKQE